MSVKQLRDILLQKERLVGNRKMSLLKDTRSNLITIPRDLLSVSNPAIPHIPKIDANVFLGPMIASVCTALSRGWEPFTQNSSYVYWALIYGAKLLLQCALGADVTGISVPVWMHLMAQSVIKKTGGFYGGQVACNFEISNDIVENYIINIGPVAYGYSLNFGLVNGPLVNGVITTITPPAAYTTAGGEAAIQHLYSYMATNGANKDMHQMVPLTDTNEMTKNLSAFAKKENSYGSGYLATGGWHQVNNHVVPIPTPLLSCWTQEPALTDEVGTAKNFNRAFTGDCISSAGLLNHVLKRNQIHMKTPPVYNPVDFTQLVVQHLTILRKAMQLYVQDSEFLELYANDPNIMDKITLQLTMQEFQIAERASFANLFSDTSALSQGLYPRSTNGSTNEFVAFLWGVGLYPIPGTTEILYPRLFRENLTALTFKQTIGGRGGSKNPDLRIPVLGKYAKDSLSYKDFTIDVVIEGVTTSYPILLAPGGEDPIEMVDGRTYSTYGAINQTRPVNLYTEEINRITIKIGEFLSPCALLSTDGGIAAFNTIIYTTLWQDGAERTTAKETPVKYMIGGKVVDKIPDKLTKQYKERFQERELKLHPIYAQRDEIIKVTAEAPIACVYESVLQFFVTPVMKRYPPADEKSTDSNVVAGNGRMPYSLVAIEGTNNFPSMAERIEIFAQMCVREKHSLPTALDTLLDEMDKNGDGGLLGEVLKTFAQTAGQALQQAAPLATLIPY